MIIEKNKSNYINKKIYKRYNIYHHLNSELLNNSRKLLNYKYNFLEKIIIKEKRNQKIILLIFIIKFKCLFGSFFY